MLWAINKSIGNEIQSTQTENQDVAGATSGGDGDRVSIKNLLTVAKLTKSKKLDLPKANFAKVNCFGTDFLTFEAKKAFIYLQKTFVEALILRHFDPKYYIHIKTNVLRYAISEVLSQMILNQHFSDHVIYEGPNSEIFQ